MSPHLVSGLLASSRLVLCRLISSRIVSSRLVSSRLVSSRLVSSRLVIRFDRFFAALGHADRRVPTTVPAVSGPLDSADSVAALRTPTRTTRQLGHHDHLPSLLIICLLIII